MRLKKGSKVEIFSRKEVQTGYWLCAEIISGNGHTYSVRYGCFPMASEALVERVPRKAIRPCPPPGEGVDSWFPGDHVELFENMSWKTVVVVKALDGNNFLVRRLGECKEFRAHRSNLRARQCWEDEKWILVGKGDANCTMSMKKNQTITSTKFYDGENGFQVEKNMGVQESHISSRTRKRASPAGLTYLEAHYVAVLKVKAIEKDGYPERKFAQRPYPLIEKVNPHLSPLEKLGEKFVRSGTPRTDSSASASSVGSCSANGAKRDILPFLSMKDDNEDTGSFCSDAESFCGRVYKEERCYPSKKEECALQDHRLELHAYRSIMKALYASGPLSWDDEMKVTDIRRVLHISNDEHLVELRNLIAC